jgi:hypothetical protein
VARWNVDSATEDRAPKHFPCSMYTNSGKGRSRCLQGWAQEGNLQFNELYTLVGRDRCHHVCFENELLTIWQSNSKTYNPHCQVTVTETEDDIFPANNLVGLARPGDQGANKSDDDSE